MSPENQPESLTSFRAANWRRPLLNRSPCKRTRSSELRSAPERIRTSDLRFRRTTLNSTVGAFHRRRRSSRCIGPPRSELRMSNRAEPRDRPVPRFTRMEQRASQRACSSAECRVAWIRAVRVSLLLSTNAGAGGAPIARLLAPARRPQRERWCRRRRLLLCAQGCRRVTHAPTDGSSVVSRMRPPSGGT